MNKSLKCKILEKSSQILSKSSTKEINADQLDALTGGEKEFEM